MQDLIQEIYWTLQSTREFFYDSSNFWFSVIQESRYKMNCDVPKTIFVNLFIGSHEKSWVKNKASMIH